MYITAIVLAAGKGRRLKAKIFKPLIKINSKPVIHYCLSILSRHPHIKDIIVVANTFNAPRITTLIKKYRIGKVRDIVYGGRRRQDSVRNALKAVDRRTDFVLIHDSVRPFVDAGVVSGVIKAAKRFGAAIVGVPVKATIKEVVSGQLSVISKIIVKKTLNRNSLWEIQTPQVFRKDLLLKAYERFGSAEVTDDAMLVEKLGAKVRVVLGSYNNIKITTPEDLVIAEAISKKL